MTITTTANATATVNRNFFATPIRKTNYAVKNAEALRNLVSDYMFATFWYAEVKIERENALKQVNDRIDGLRNFRGSAQWNTHFADALLQCMDERSELESKLDAWIVNAGAKWTLEKDSHLDNCAKTYQRAFKATGDAEYSVCKAVSEFYEAYGLVCGQQDMEYLLYTLGGLRAQRNAKAIAKSNQTIWTKARAKRDFAETLLCSLAEIMVEANCVRPVNIAPELAEKWASKAQRKAQAKAKAQETEPKAEAKKMA